MKKRYLLAPGPTPVPESALLAMAQPIIHHRTPQFSEVFKETAELLKYVFQTKQDVLMLAASGTGAMEGSITNLFSPGEQSHVQKRGENCGEGGDKLPRPPPPTPPGKPVGGLLGPCPWEFFPPLSPNFPPFYDDAFVAGG